MFFLGELAKLSKSDVKPQLSLGNSLPTQQKGTMLPMFQYWELEN